MVDDFIIFDIMHLEEYDENYAKEFFLEYLISKTGRTLCSVEKIALTGKSYLQSGFGFRD